MIFHKKNLKKLFEVSFGQNADPRIYQITILATLLLYGIFFLHFATTIWKILTLVSVSLLTQFVFSCLYSTNPQEHKTDKLHGSNEESASQLSPHSQIEAILTTQNSQIQYKSAFITALSLCLLLQTNNLWIAALAGFVAIASKFIVRWQNKHIFNPANIGLVLVVLLTQQAWVSPSQWGSAAFFAFLLACLGGMVVFKALRSDIALSFLAFYCALLLARTLWLGDNLAIYFHQIQSGALLLFSFFMISDPKTSPSSREGRILFAFLVAIYAFVQQFWFFRSSGPIFGLAFLALLVPIIDILLPGIKYEWLRNSASIQGLKATNQSLAKQA